VVVTRVSRNTPVPGASSAIDRRDLKISSDPPTHDECRMVPWSDAGGPTAVAFLAIRIHRAKHQLPRPVPLIGSPSFNPYCDWATTGEMDGVSWQSDLATK